MTVSLREQTALTAARVRDEYLRSGAVPGELVRFIQAEVLRRGGGIVPLEKARQMAESYSEAWAESLLREDDNRQDSRMSKAERIRRIRSRAADLDRERAERAAHVPKVMIVKE